MMLVACLVPLLVALLKALVNPAAVSFLLDCKCQEVMILFLHLEMLSENVINFFTWKCYRKSNIFLHLEMLSEMLSEM